MADEHEVTGDPTEEELLGLVDRLIDQLVVALLDGGGEIPPELAEWMEEQIAPWDEPGDR